MAQQVFNGKTITIDTDEDIIPVYYDDSGEVKVAGRTDFWFVLISGSVRTTLEDGFYGNLRADGSGVVRVLW